MNTKIAVILFGLVALSAADYSNLRLRSSAPVKSYGQPAPVVEQREVLEEEPMVAYKAPVKTVVKTPTRIVQEPAVSNYGYSNAGVRSVKVEADNERITEEQNNSAKYTFGSAIDDGIQDHSHVRQETRDGLKVEGSYAYSDGYFKRVVNYVADENGYRVVSESVEPISESGPKVDLENGKVDVHTQIGGIDNQYSVSAQEINHYKLLTLKDSKQ